MFILCVSSYVVMPFTEENAAASLALAGWLYTFSLPLPSPNDGVHHRALLQTVIIVNNSGVDADHLSGQYGHSGQLGKALASLRKTQTMWHTCLGCCHPLYRGGSLVYEGIKQIVALAVPCTFLWSNNVPGRLCPMGCVQCSAGGSCDLKKSGCISYNLGGAALWPCGRWLHSWLNCVHVWLSSQQEGCR